MFEIWFIMLAENEGLLLSTKFTANLSCFLSSHKKILLWRDVILKPTESPDAHLKNGTRDF